MVLPPSETCLFRHQATDTPPKSRQSARFSIVCSSMASSLALVSSDKVRWRTKHNGSLDNRSTPWLAEHKGSEQLYDETTKTRNEGMSTTNTRRLSHGIPIDHPRFPDDQMDLGHHHTLVISPFPFPFLWWPQPPEQHQHGAIGVYGFSCCICFYTRRVDIGVGRRSYSDTPPSTFMVR